MRVFDKFMSEPTNPNPGSHHDNAKHRGIRRHIMKLPRRTFLKFTGAVATAAALPRVATARTYPTRPITLIVPVAAGSSSDVISRVVADRMSKSLGQPIIIENVSGADGTIGTGRAARAVPDGYTIDMGFTSTHVLNGAIYSLSYDLLSDFAPISPLTTSSLVLYARRTIPAKDLRELIAWLKSNPNKASAGVYTASYRLINALLQRQTGTQFTLVPYRGSVREMQDLVAGQIDLCFDTPALLPLVRAGSIKVYAVTSDTRMALAPEITPFAEMGLPIRFHSLSGWGFSRLRTPRRTSSPSSMPRLWKHWPILRFNLGFPTLGFRSFRARDKPPKVSAHGKRPISRNGGRSLRNWGSRRNEVAGTIPRLRVWPGACELPMIGAAPSVRDFLLRHRR
jgi:tripartite-type tricarboxylate transporter receptor subunit TctC